MSNHLNLNALSTRERHRNRCIYWPPVQSVYKHDTWIRIRLSQRYLVQTLESLCQSYFLLERTADGTSMYTTLCCTSYIILLYIPKIKALWYPKDFGGKHWRHKCSLPIVKRWFISPSNNSYLRTIYHSELVAIGTSLAIVSRGPTLHISIYRYRYLSLSLSSGWRLPRLWNKYESVGMMKFPRYRIKMNLVGGSNPSEKYQSVGMIISNIWETCSKPPTRN